MLDLMSCTVHMLCKVSYAHEFSLCLVVSLLVVKALSACERERANHCNIILTLPSYLTPSTHILRGQYYWRPLRNEQ